MFLLFSVPKKKKNDVENNLYLSLEHNLYSSNILDTKHFFTFWLRITKLSLSPYM